MVYSQSDLSPSLVSLHHSYPNKSLACESILNEELFFSKYFSYTQPEVYQIENGNLDILFAKKKNFFERFG